MQHPTTWTLLIATGMSLGLSVPLGKLAVSHGVAPVSFVMLPALFAGLVLAGFAWLRHGAPDGPRRLLGFGLVTGMLGHAVPNTLTAWLASQAGASVTAIAFTLPPVFTLVLSLLFGFERAHRQRVIAVALGLAGALWLASSRISGGELSLLGALTLFVIPVSIGAGNVYRARFLPRAVPAEWLGAAMTLGAFAWLLPLWALGPAASSGVPASGLPYLLAQVAVAALAATLFFQLQRRADAVTMSFVGYALALTAVLSGALLLDEQLPWQLLPAAALIAAGFWLIQRHANRHAPTPPSHHPHLRRCAP
jgi:drug/metabolite transporter (DMT)-like permease